MALPTNVCGAEKGFRLVLGVAFLVIALTGFVSSTVGLVLIVLGVVLLVTGAISFCPITHLMGISTCKPVEAEGPTDEGDGGS
jgi:hypothetical protein